MSRAGPFLALTLKTLQESNLLVLTPRVMRWSDSVWLFDLGPCLEYWQQRAQRVGSDWNSLLRQILLTAFFEEKKGQLQASLASHPWKAVLLLTAVSGKKLRGVFDFEGADGQVLYANLSWRSWFRCAAAAGEHFAGAGEPSFRKGDLFREILHMKRAMSRLSLSKPVELQDASPASIQRRFGPQLAKLWRWTQREASGELFEQFPWRGWSLPEKPSVKRDLEFPLGEWEPLAELLIEDLDRLCNLPCWSEKEKVIRLNWDLEFDRLSSLCLPIFFRYPHGLHLERGAHPTTLIQARYGLSEAGEKIIASRRADEFQLVSLLSWKLTVEERIIPPARFPDLFGEKDCEEEQYKLTRLENQLRVPLDHYAFQRDWLYVDSFSRLAQGEAAKPLDEQAQPWLQIARARPILLYAKPQRLEPEGAHEKVFLERTGLKWWREGKSVPSHRDFYALLDPQFRLQWVSKGRGGAFYAHGIFA